MFFDLEISDDSVTSKELPLFVTAFIAVFTLILLSILMWVLFSFEKAAPNLATLALDNVSKSGVDNPVTAVLLNFRAYDTMLEIAVLLVVATIMLPAYSHAITPSQNKRLDSQPVPIDPVSMGLFKWLVSLSVLIGTYLLWTGAYFPGGAFQAGAVLAAAGLALSLVERKNVDWQAGLMRFGLLVGLCVFLLVSVFNAITTGTAMQYPVNMAGSLILVIEVAATVSIASVLLSLFVQLKEAHQ